MPIYTNIFAPPLPQPRRFVAAGQGDPRDGRVVGERPAGRDHRHRPPVAGARRAAPVRRARPGPGVRPQGRRLDRLRRHRRLPGRGDAGPPARPGQRHPRVHGLHADDGRRRRGRRRPTTSTASTCSTRWRPTSPGTRTERRHDEQVPAGQVPLHRRPRPRAGRALPRGPGRHGRPGGRPRWPTRILNCTPASRPPGWRSPTRSGRRCAQHDHVALFEMGAHPFLTLTLFIAMFERDHGPLEYQMAYGKATGAPLPAVPRHRDLSRARRRPHPPTGEPPVEPAEHPDPAAAARGQARRPGDRGSDRAAGPALRVRHVLLRRARRCPTCPGVQGVGVVERPPAAAGHAGVRSPPRAGMAPGDGSLAELCRGPDEDVGPAGRRRAGRRRSRRSGCPAVAAWMALTWRAGLRPGERVRGARRRRRGRPGRRRRRRALGAGRVVAACRRRGRPGARAGGRGRRRPSRQRRRRRLADGAARRRRRRRRRRARPGLRRRARPPPRGCSPSGGRLVNLGGAAGDTPTFSSAAAAQPHSLGPRLHEQRADRRAEGRRR